MGSVPQPGTLSKRCTHSDIYRSVLHSKPRRRCASRATSDYSDVVQVAPQTLHRPSTSASSQLHGEQVKLFYRSGWDRALVHGTVDGEKWKDYVMSKVSSAPGKWFVGKLPLNGSSLNGSRPPIEFVLTNGAGDWDKPEAGGNYTVGGPGTYALDSGAIRPVHGNAPVLVVSDLDGTMVGDDAATAAFKQFWEEEGVLNGGVLVYNTGRSLQAFQQLLREKPSLAHPDALITAVGTKIYSFNGSSWVEDKGYAALLDKDWTVQVVRDAAYLALAKVGKDRMHFRPPEEQSQHKVTCGVQQSALPEVLAHLRRSLAAGGADANLIASGTGDWRFLDIVPRQAGKLQALEYVQKMFGFGHGSTVACGDSGNDILMLSGECLAVVVGNAQPDLVEWVAEQQQREQPGTDGKQRLRVTQRHEALGILEGLEYFGFKSQSA